MMLCAAGQPVSCQQLRSSLLQRQARPLLPCVCQHDASIGSSVRTGINSALAMMPQQLQGSRSSRCYVLAAASKKSSAVAGGKGFGSATKTTPSKSSSRANQSCPCGSGKSYQSCCGRYHQGVAAAPTPEALLRARFSAYALQQIDYLVATTHKQNPEHTGDPVTYARSLQRVARATEYVKLNIIGPVQPQQSTTTSSSSSSAPDPAASSSSSSSSDSDAYIRFSVEWKVKGAPGAPDVATETSHFKKVNGTWMYFAAVE